MPQAALTESLEKLLDTVIDRDLSGRLREVYLAAAHCISNLASINLLKFEPTTADDGSADLSLWEVMAPALRDTVVAVNTLCDEIERQFPLTRSRVTQYGADTSDERLEGEAAVVFRSVARRLRDEVAEVGTFMKRPELLGSRWLLLGELQRLRADLRRKVGDAFYLSAVAIGPVRRDEVVPDFESDVRRAVVFRATTADVCRFVETALGKDQPARQKAAAILSNFEVFAAMPAWKHVRASAKQQMLAARQQLAVLAASAEVTAETLDAVVVPVIDQLESISHRQTAELLFAHDLDAWSRAMSAIEQARLHVTLETRSGLHQLQQALEAADLLRGRDDLFDAEVRKVRKASADARADDPVAMWVDALHRSLTNVRFGDSGR